MNKIILAGIATMASSGAALATNKCGFLGGASKACAVPEISAMEGSAALAALAAVLFIAWERRRRAV